MPRAVVFSASDAPLRVETLTLADPGPRQIRVRLHAAGVCHSDLSVYRGAGVALPMVLGHEGAGVVVGVGTGVTDFSEGDHVVLCTVIQCGNCASCRAGFPTLCRSQPNTFTGSLPDGSLPLALNGEPVRQMAGIGCWSEEVVVDQRSAVRVDSDMPLTSAALLGCAVVTGFGAVSNVAKVASGDTMAVIGCGGVGLNAIQAGAIAGASRIIAVDLSPAKLELAREFGATDVVDSSAGDAVEAVRDLTDGAGTTFAFDFVGLAATSRQALSMTHLGGTIVLTGLGQAEVSFNVGDLIRGGRTVKGNFMGMGDFRTEYAQLVTHYQEGRLKLDELVSAELGIHQVDKAFESMLSGAVARSVLLFN